MYEDDEPIYVYEAPDPRKTPDGRIRPVDLDSYDYDDEDAYDDRNTYDRWYA